MLAQFGDSFSRERRRQWRVPGFLHARFPVLVNSNFLDVNVIFAIIVLVGAGLSYLTKPEYRNLAAEKSKFVAAILDNRPSLDPV
ncbi:MAG: hypothetical protein WB760_26460 [Xanthobacteraceae bacterium]